jgi:L-fuculose-phosphate aldolase
VIDVADAGRAVVAVCRSLYQRGLIAGSDGNVSVRINDQHLLVTPSGVSKGDVTVEDLVEVTLAGTHVRGTRRASSEIDMHLQLYNERSDIGAVVHAHPPTATAFSVAGEGIAPNVLPELVVQVGDVARVPYGTPGTPELSAAMAPFVSSHNAFLLTNHGATTVGSSLSEAHYRMESLEHGARILFMARLLGRVDTLSAPQVDALVHARSQLTPWERHGEATDRTGLRSKES